MRSSNLGFGVFFPVDAQFIQLLIVGVGKRGAYELVHGDPPRQHSFGTTLRFTGLVPADSRQLLLLLFLTFSVLVANPKKLLYTVANPARGLLNREKRTREKVWQHTPPPTPHIARSEKINKITRRIYRRYAGLGRSRVRTRIPSARRIGLWVWLRKILHSRLR